MPTRIFLIKRGTSDVSYRDNMPRGYASRGGSVATEIDRPGMQVK